MLQKLQTIGEDFCGLDVNTPLGGELPIAAIPVLVFGSHLTAVAATSTGDYTVVFLGTANGHLKKVSLKPNRVLFKALRWRVTGPWPHLITATVCDADPRQLTFI